MKQQASSKSQKFRVEIRRKQRDDIMKVSRQVKQNGTEQNKQSGSLVLFKENKVCSSKQEVLGMIEVNTVMGEGSIQSEKNSKIKKLYNDVLNNANFMDALAEESIKSILEQIALQQVIEMDEGINLLSTFIQYCGCRNANTKKRENILSVLQKVHIQQILFKEINKNIKNQMVNRVKLLLNCLKFLALNQMEGIRRMQLLQLYLPTLISKFINEPSLMLFLIFVSEVHLFNQEVIQIVCQQCQSKHLLVKMAIVSILNNYITLQNNANEIALMFELMLRTLTHIIVTNKGQSLNSTRNTLQSIIKLISKYPQGKQQQLLIKISKCKFQELALVMLTICDESIKQIIFDVEDTIIDKCIHQLKQGFFMRFDMEVVYMVVQGLVHTRGSIILKCLNILVKIVKYAPQYVIKKIKCQNLIQESLENLCFYKNQRIAGLAQFLNPYFCGDSSQVL